MISPDKTRPRTFISLNSSELAGTFGGSVEFNKGEFGGKPFIKYQFHWLTFQRSNEQDSKSKHICTALKAV